MKIELDELLDAELKEKVDREHKLYLVNDDVNTFDHVVDSLVAICKHEPIQAEQCALLTHYKGVCEIKRGKYKDLIKMADGLMDRQLRIDLQ